MPPSEEQTYRKGIDDHLTKQDKQLEDISKSLEEQRQEFLSNLQFTLPHRA